MIRLHGSGTQTNAITALFGAKRSAGFYPKEAYCPDPQAFLPYPEEEPEIWRNLRLLEFLGVPLEGDHLEFPLSQEDYLELNALPQTQGLRPREYVCIHPGARWAHKRWPAEHFAIDLKPRFSQPSPQGRKRNGLGQLSNVLGDSFK